MYFPLPKYYALKLESYSDSLFTPAFAYEF